MSSQFEDAATTYKQHTILGYSKSIFLGAEKYTLCNVYAVYGLSLNLNSLQRHRLFIPFSW